MQQCERSSREIFFVPLAPIIEHGLWNLSNIYRYVKIIISFYGLNRKVGLHFQKDKIQNKIMLCSWKLMPKLAHIYIYHNITVSQVHKILLRAHQSL